MTTSLAPTASDTGTTTVRFPDPSVAVIATGFELDRAGRRLTVALLPDLASVLSAEPVTAAAARVRGLSMVDGLIHAVSADRTSIDVIDCMGGQRRFGCALLVDGAGLALAPDGTLLVADTGADRVDGFDPATTRLVARWAVPAPQDLLVDGDDVLVVAADGVRRLQLDGSSPLVHAVEGGRSLARLGPTLLIGTTDGVTAFDPTGAEPPESIVTMVEASLGGLAGPFLVRTVDDRLALSAPTSATVVVTASTSESMLQLGDLGRVPATVLGLIADPDHRVWAADADTVAIVTRVTPTDRATATVGPIPLALDPAADHRARVRVRGGLTAADVDLTVRFVDVGGNATGDPDPGSPGRADRLIGVPPTAAAVKLDLRIETTGTAPAWVDLIELRLDQPGLIDLLPEIYRTEGRPDDFLDPFLRLLSAGFDEVVELLGELPDQFDPTTAVDDLDGRRWLDYLSTWVDADLSETWLPELRRQEVAEAFAWHARRGTAAALTRRIRHEHGIEVSIDEPAQRASVWILGDEHSELGFTTMTTAAPAEGSILERTVELDRSHLIGQNDRGAPLFGDLAHRFRVLIPPWADRPGVRQRVATTVAREAPAHTHAHVCVEPATVVGHDAVIGLTTFVGPSDPDEPTSTEPCEPPSSDDIRSERPDVRGRP